MSSLLDEMARVSDADKRVALRWLSHYSGVIDDESVLSLARLFATYRVAGVAAALMAVHEVTR
jgi:hypothetical protein